MFDKAVISKTGVPVLLLAPYFETMSFLNQSEEHDYTLLYTVSLHYQAH
jgi:hypothetical protein